MTMWVVVCAGFWWLTMFTSMTADWRLAPTMAKTCFKSNYDVNICERTRKTTAPVWLSFCALTWGPLLLTIDYGLILQIYLPTNYPVTINMAGCSWWDMGPKAPLGGPLYWETPIWIHMDIWIRYDFNWFHGTPPAYGSEGGSAIAAEDLPKASASVKPRDPPDFISRTADPFWLNPFCAPITTNRHTQGRIVCN